MKQLLKRTAGAIAPEWTTAILSARSRLRSHRLVQAWELDKLGRKLLDRFGSTVQTGPFRGMALSPMTHLEHIGPFLLGSYESELHSWLEEVIDGEFACVLDVGAKFGYYAVGLARRMPNTPVIAFDTDWWARAATQEMATANGTPHVSVAGFCSPRWLDRELRPNSFLLVDCEGYEGQLFFESRTPALDSATLLIECHDNLLPGVGAIVRERFAKSHSVESVKLGPRQPLEVDLSFLTPSESESASHEVRGPQEWLLFKPLATMANG